MSIDKNICVPYVDSEDEQFRAAVSSLQKEDIPLKDKEMHGKASDDSAVSGSSASVSPRARCELQPRDVRQYPARMPGTTTKDRRYMVQRVKATDKGKALGKRPLGKHAGPSSKSYQQLKSEDFPHSDE